MKKLIDEMIIDEELMLRSEVFGGNIVKQENHKGALRVLRYLSTELFQRDKKPIENMEKEKRK